MIRPRMLALALVLAAPSLVAAQRDTAAARLIVKTVTLHHLTSAEATKLLSPYIRTNGGGVYDTPNIRAVTIRESQPVYNEMMTVLGRYDREPATITLNFELVAGYTCANCPAATARGAGPVSEGVDSLMRKVLKYQHYRLLSATTASADEQSRVELTLLADGDPMRLDVILRDVRIDDNQPLIVIDGVTQKTPPASVHLDISLSREAIPARGQTPGRAPSLLFSSGVTVPIGETIVMGSAVTALGATPSGAGQDARPNWRGRGESDTDGALILVVRPQIGTVKR